MSLKSIEMQVALPRTHEAGKIQEQLQQRSQLSHDLAAQSVQKEEVKQRSTVTKQEQKEKAGLGKDGGKNGSENSSRQNREREKKDAVRPENHPYKGKNIDYSG